VAKLLGLDSLMSTKVFANWQPFWFLAEARVHLLERASDYERRQQARDARKTWRVHRRFAKLFRIALPTALAEQGRGLFLLGMTSRGMRLLDEAEGAAEELANPYVRARARYYRALCLQPGAPGRRQNLEAARTGFAALGCEWDERLVVNELRNEGWLGR
jgi:hypothetical protein